MARLPPLTEPLCDTRACLRDAAERDIPEILIAHEDDRSLHLRLFRDRPPSGAELGRLAESAYADRVAGSRATLTLVVPGNDVCVGQLQVHDLDWEHARGELSIWVAPGSRRRGLATAALGLAGDWLLEDCRLARVQILVELDNQAMLTAAARAGFRDEGVLRAHLRRRSGRCDVRVLSLLPADREPA